MKSISALGAGILALSLLSGCIDESGGGAMAPVTPPGNEPEAAARGACVRDVKKATGNSDVMATSSSFSEAGTEVFLKVGPTGSWRCIAYRDGTTTGIQSMTNEGSL